METDALRSLLQVEFVQLSRRLHIVDCRTHLPGSFIFTFLGGRILKGKEFTVSDKEKTSKLSSAGQCVLGTSLVNHEGPDHFITMTRFDTTVYNLSRLTIVASPAGKVTMLIDKPLDKLELRPTSDKCDEYVTTPFELHHVKAYVGQDEDLQNALKDTIQDNPFLRSTSIGVLVRGLIEEYPVKPNDLVRIRCKSSVRIYLNEEFNLMSLLNQIQDENKENQGCASPEVKKTLGSDSFLNAINDQNFAWDLGEKAATDRKLRDSLFSFVRLVNKGCFDIILHPSEVEWLLDAVICRARETMHDEDIKRFIGMFEGLGYQFKYTTRDGWSVISLPPKVKKRAEQLMRGEVSGETA